MSFNLLVLCFLTASQDSCQGKGHCRTSLNFAPTSLLLVVLHESISYIKMQVQFFGFRSRRTEQKLKLCSLNGANERNNASRNSFNSQFLKDTVCIQRNFFSFQFQFQVKPNWFANINFFLQLRLSSFDGFDISSFAHHFKIRKGLGSCEWMDIKFQNRMFSLESWFFGLLKCYLDLALPVGNLPFDRDSNMHRCFNSNSIEPLGQFRFNTRMQQLFDIADNHSTKFSTWLLCVFTTEFNLTFHLGNCWSFQSKVYRHTRFSWHNVI